MNLWMDGCLDGWKDLWMDEWIYGWMDVWMDEWIYGWMDGFMDGFMYGFMDGQMDGLRMDRWMDGWMGGWVDGWIDGAMQCNSVLFFPPIAAQPFDPGLITSLYWIESFIDITLIYHDLCNKCDSLIEIKIYHL